LFNVVGAAAERGSLTGMKRTSGYAPAGSPAIAKRRPQRVAKVAQKKHCIWLEISGI
jgi:hypothetical protein